MAYYDEITMLRLGLGRWRQAEPANTVQERDTPGCDARRPGARQDGPQSKVESPSEPD
ncbi:hypothetical protein SAMN05216196_11240 [Lutimaribacter pacificus]|uniref:Uncharacterized protein n=1 Tax=Lutimaribacter pacificus TaxID=391948 RepID=A0A1H0N8E8_9RHOB|nr:hypothetical protein [Lutimaribacter pacificus]SDO88952.1 hypothetical protein SAMN05216196_11240 [Lutimaribacter pacificus]SHK85763.1 hypothetical protein SAMN05444142_11137 [Lutimaribacter pacificus]